MPVRSVTQGRRAVRFSKERPALKETFLDADAVRLCEHNAAEIFGDEEIVAASAERGNLKMREPSRPYIVCVAFSPESAPAR